MEVGLLLALLRLVQKEKRSFGLPQAGRLTTVAADITGRLKAGDIRINRVGIVVRFVGVVTAENLSFNLILNYEITH